MIISSFISKYIRKNGSSTRNNILFNGANKNKANRKSVKYLFQDIIALNVRYTLY